jgi:anti-sigma regulatory factor (Ser/Thr protein kinase)
MLSLILSKEFDDVVFLRFVGNENFDGGEKLNELFDEIRKAKRKFIIADFDSMTILSDETLYKIIDFANDIYLNYFWKLCFTAQNTSVYEKIKIACNKTNLKNFRNLSDAINYFYWDCNKVREVVKMKMPSDISLVPSVRTCISDFVSICEVSKKTLFQIELIIDELCNNAIEHGTQDLGKTIEVQCSIDEEFVEIIVYNGYSSIMAEKKTGHEIGKDMEKWAASPSKTGNDFRGRGLGLVKKYSDSFEINSSNDGTWVYVAKRKGT